MKVNLIKAVINMSPESNSEPENPERHPVCYSVKHINF